MRRSIIANSIQAVYNQRIGSSNGDLSPNKGLSLTSDESFIISPIHNSNADY